MTFTLGLGSVLMINDSLKFSDEISVNLPETQFDSQIIVFYGNPPPGGSGCDFNKDNSREIRNNSKKINAKLNHSKKKAKKVY